MAISQELENAIRGSIHSPGGAADLIDLCNQDPFAGSVSEVHASYLTALSGISAPSITGTNAAFATAISAASLLATNVSVGTGLTALAASIGSVSIGASNISALTGVYKSIDCSTGMTANALTAGSAVVSTNLTVRSVMSASSITGAAGSITALTAGSGGFNHTTGNEVCVGATLNRGGLSSDCTSAAGAYTNATLIGSPVALISVTAAAQNFFRLPVAALGIKCDVVNYGGSTIGLLGASSGVSVVGGASTALATADAVGCGLPLICDGTNWHRRSLD